MAKIVDIAGYKVKDYSDEPIQRDYEKPKDFNKGSSSTCNDLKEYNKELRIAYDGNRIIILNGRVVYCLKREHQFGIKGKCKKFRLEYRVSYNDIKFNPGIYYLLRFRVKAKVGKLFGFRISWGDTRLNNFKQALRELGEMFKNDLVYAVSYDVVDECSDLGSKYPEVSTYWLIPIITDISNDNQAINNLKNSQLDNETINQIINENKIALARYSTNPNFRNEVRNQIYELLNQIFREMNLKSAVKQYNLAQKVSAITSARMFEDSSKGKIMSLAYASLISALSVGFPLVGLAELVRSLINGFFGGMEIFGVDVYGRIIEHKVDEYKKYANPVYLYRYMITGSLDKNYSPAYALSKLMNVDIETAKNLLSKGSNELLDLIHYESKTK